MNTIGIPVTQTSVIAHGAESACALVIHVWHLDTLDDLASASANFPADADQFVSYSNSFSSEVRQMIADKLPGARHVPVHNAGQDVGALFQVMDHVDLGRYEFICKIHSKKGAKMPESWRRTLLGGVLGSRDQVDSIIHAFSTDPQIKLAGAEQLFLYGPAYLWNNAQGIQELCEPLLQGFDFRTQPWGFIAGTCFWIRTDILQRLKGLEISFEPGTYTDDGTPAHTLERMFGMMVSIDAGKVLLQDQRDFSKLPQSFTGFPPRLSRERVPIVVTLTNLEEERRRLNLQHSSQRRRVAIFAISGREGLLPPQVLPFLQGLRPFVEKVIAVFDNEVDPAEVGRLAGLADHVILEWHEEHDLGSYKRGFHWADRAGCLDETDELILCNDSCFGPIGSFQPMFRQMEARHLDFWGAADSRETCLHLKSFFMALSWQVVHSSVFMSFMREKGSLLKTTHVTQNYAADLSRILGEAGFRQGAFVENRLAGVHPDDPTFRDITEHPLRAIEMGLPLIKVKALRSARFNAEGTGRTLEWLQEHAPVIYQAVSGDMQIQRFADAGQIHFSLIMPTRNRAWCILDAVRSVMAQSHLNFELIIVDDGSTDNTAEVLKKSFSTEINIGKLRYIRLNKSEGVCAARNIGIFHAKYDWISYIDSDNQLRPNFLSVLANSIIENPQGDCFYGQIINRRTGSIVGQKFTRHDILRGNYIDLGTFVHRKSLVYRFGGFDPQLRRLVDWDLIIRFTAHKDPIFIPRIFLDYTDDEDGDNADRISVRESFLKAKVAVHAKHSPRPVVSSVILSYNHQEFIVEAIESALEQRGDFTHEILLSDDGSSDATARIMQRYAARYPKQIRNISTGRNSGISENYKHCFREAGGRFISILEGDDYWTDPDKNARQADFLASNGEAGAVFSRIELFDMAENSRRVLGRQNNLPSLLTGAHFAQNKHLNLIVNFSSIMIRRQIIENLPSAIYQPRLSEITLAFYLDRLGKIGFINEVMGVYRLNTSSVWTGASQAGKLEQALATRTGALAVADPAYHPVIRRRIEEKKRDLDALLAGSSTIQADQG